MRTQEESKLIQIISEHGGTSHVSPDTLHAYFDYEDCMQACVVAIRPHLNGHLQLSVLGMQINIKHIFPIF